MRKIIPFLLLPCIAGLAQTESLQKFEGFYGSGEETPEEIAGACQRIVAAFFPWNAIFVDAGASSGINTEYFAKNWPFGQIIVFEPNPAAFAALRQTLEPYHNVTYCNTALNLYNGYAQLHLFQKERDAPLSSSLLEASPSIPASPLDAVRDVPCVVLDDWCKSHRIPRIDVLHLDAEGFELQILQTSPEILTTVIALWVKTHASKSRIGMTPYPRLKTFLEDQGFTFLSHWYQEDAEGDALFLRDYIYDALFK